MSTFGKKDIFGGTKVEEKVADVVSFVVFKSHQNMGEQKRTGIKGPSEASNRPNKHSIANCAMID